MNKIKITPEFLADLKAKAERATSGNWFIICAGRNAYAIGAETKPYETLIVSSYYSPNERRVYGLPNKSDADHIAAANPQVVLSFISEIERLWRRENFYARAMAEYHQVAKMAWDGEIPSPLPGHESSEEKMIKQFEYLNCPACGGSGHVGDCDEAIQNLKCDLVNAQSKIKKLERELDGLCHDDTEKELKIERLEK